MEVNEKLETGAYYTFDTYILDPDTRTLRHDDKLVDLTPKVFKTLLVLVENRDKVLTRDELLAIIWPDQFVEESNLSQNISVLRRSLGEAESGKKYIATFPGRGYRFVSRVEVKRHREEDRSKTSPDPESSSVNEVETASIHVGPNSRSAGSKDALRYWIPISIVVLGVVILVTIAAFAIYENIRHSRLRGVAEDNAHVKVYARMSAALSQPSWSSDGKSLAFVAIDLGGDRSTMYIQSAGDIQPHGVMSDSGQYSSPAWSPDGKLLAFVHFGLGIADIVIFDAQRKSSRVLTKLFVHRYGLNYRHLDWSPDGKSLVVDDKDQESEPFSLYLVYIESGQRVRLTYPDSDIIGDVSPRVSPDGTRVAFIRDIYLYQQDVYVANVRGRTSQRITSVSTLISDVGWKTGASLVFAADHGDGFNFWQVNLTKLDQKETMASRVDSDRALQFSISQNGQAVAFSNYSPNLDIWSIDIAKPSSQWIPVIQAPGENIRPSVSPDGRLLAFLSNVSGNFQIWVSQVDGSNSSAVSTGALVPASFCWSSDGNSLVFSPQRAHGVYEVPLHGRAAVTQISSDYTDPHYATDRKSLFVRAHFFIYRLLLPGGDPQKVTEQGGAAIAQSNDGRYLYFSQGRMSTTIARLDLQTGHQDEITHSLMPGYSDAWALSSRGIFFLGEEHKQPAVRFFNFANAREEHIADFPGELPQLEKSGFGISPDGEHLWVVRLDQTPSDIEVTALRSD